MKKVNIETVLPNPSNPRIIKDDKFKKLVKSIQEFPQMLELRPIVVDANMVVLGGNMRLKACKAAGLKEVPIVIADSLTEEQQAGIPIVLQRLVLLHQCQQDLGLTRTTIQCDCPLQG